MSCFSTIPYITFLGFTLLLIIGIAIFLIRRMNTQNQKFSSIIGVVTTMADELTKIKSYIKNNDSSIDIIQGSVKDEIMTEEKGQEELPQEDTPQEETQIEEESLQEEEESPKEESSIDYKKLPLQKLRSIVSKKKLVDDSSKMKKNELLQLLEK